LLRSTALRLRLKIPWSRYEWTDLRNAGSIRPGRPGKASGRAAYATLAEAVRMLKRSEADALVTGPVSKEAIAGAGIRWRGHTEYLAEAFCCKTTMMFVTGRFRVSLVTTHWAIREVPDRLRRAEVVRVLEATRHALIRDFGIRRPRIGLAALNPHGGEGGMFGREEKRVLLPAAKRFGRSVAGPLPVDSLMQAAARGEYDAVVALYHDQALIPVKLIGWEQAVNVTLGLPFVRTSPVHGTAFDIAGRGKADPSSMKAAINLAIQLASRRC
jgi:4-hydroxythreonine-4-phosphate dehydrogenase